MELEKYRNHLEALVEERTRQWQGKPTGRSTTAIPRSSISTNAPLRLSLIDPQGVIIRINDTELAWLGYQRDEIEGPHGLLPNWCVRPIGKSSGQFRASAGLRRVQGIEYDLLRRDGSLLPVILNSRSVTDANGRSSCIPWPPCSITASRERERRIIASTMPWLFRPISSSPPGTPPSREPRQECLHRQHEPRNRTPMNAIIGFLPTPASRFVRSAGLGPTVQNSGRSEPFAVYHQ